MRLTIKFLLLVQITLAVLVVLGPTKPALACSGTPATIDEILERTQYVVKATVVETDDLSQNYILEAETYIAGGAGPKYFLLTLNQPEMIEGLILGSYGRGGCESFLPTLSLGENVYLFVYRQEDGSYETASSVFNPVFYPHFTESAPATNEKVYELYLTHDDALWRKAWRPTEDEFVGFITERTGDTPTSPNSSTPYPIKAPLLLNTAAESLYLLPVDFDSPIKLEPDSQLYADYVIPHYRGPCASLNCYSTSPNGLFDASQVDAKRIYMRFRQGAGMSIDGQGFVFSPTGDAIAIWHNSAIETRIVRFVDGRWDTRLISSVELHVNSVYVFESFVGAAQWSPDGRFLAFTDADGLWLWDVYTENAEPRLLIPVAENGDLPVADYFSPRGRYLAFSQGTAKETLDTISGQHYPYGLVSPDERSLIVELPMSQLPFEICSFTPYRCNQHTPYIIQVAWQNKHSFVAIACYRPSSCNLETYSDLDTTDLGISLYSQAPGEMFAYDSPLDLLAVLSEGYTVTINDTALDLTDSLDGYVVSLEWLPSMFYFVD